MLNKDFCPWAWIGDVPKGSMIEFEIDADWQGLKYLAPCDSGTDLIFKVERIWIDLEFPTMNVGFINPAGAFTALDQFCQGIDE